MQCHNYKIYINMSNSRRQYLRDVRNFKLLFDIKAKLIKTLIAIFFIRILLIITYTNIFKYSLNDIV